MSEWESRDNGYKMSIYTIKVLNHYFGAKRRSWKVGKRYGDGLAF